MSKGSTKKISTPKKSKKLAEFIGIMLGDGNLHFYKRGKKVGVYMVRIAGNSKKDSHYLRNYVAPLCKKLFNIEPKFYLQPNKDCLYVLMHSRRLVEFLMLKGLKSGNKIVNQATMPAWVWERKSWLAACIRGLVDTDGCINEMTPHWPGLFQLSFENRSFRLLSDYRAALVHLGLKPSKICGSRTRYGTKVYLSSKKEIGKYQRLIGSNNPRISSKFEFFPH